MKLLVVEDDVSLAKNLIQGFAESGFEVVHASTVAIAKKRLEEPVDLVVLDLGLPDGDGLDLIQVLRERAPEAPMIITTARGELDHRLRGLEGGADDYLVKPYAFVELLARVRALLRRTQQRGSGTWRVGDLEIDPVARRVARANQALELTAREYDLLVRLVRAQGSVVTREMLAREIWHQRAWTASLDNAIDVHISRLREKLDKGQPARLLHTVRGVGFLLKEEPCP
ncbi:MAG TPA: response regulator transcription factor [Candidatus Paceibacterota bacterium]|nr:response regulator transcription factor [Verrucomicrobiota bacterium]HRY46510.1 response regulator transcription factor [Candidatus Paceibacterota bacterium]HRZ99861.1 response regulator transcription factor [Candidatus Paceibacterota bacterium]